MDTLPLDLAAAFLVSPVEAANLEMMKDELRGFKGFEEGKRWCGLVSKLHSRFTEWRLPSSARKDGERNSPFVVFFIFFNGNGLPMHGATCRAWALLRKPYRKQSGR
jgi:hypothetical protein